MPGPYRIAFHGNRVGRGAAGSLYVQVHAVAKSNDPIPYCIPNELICSEIGRHIRLPLPPAGIIRDEAGKKDLFASLNFNLTADELAPVDTTRCWKELPFLSTGLIAFDILIANDDRSASNFAVDFSRSPPAMNVFDHSHALFGATGGQGQQRLSQHKNSFVVDGHCLLPLVDSEAHFGEWIKRIKDIPDYVIEESIADAKPYGLSETEVQAANQFLKSRRDQLSQIIGSNKEKFKGVKQWNLL